MRTNTLRKILVLAYLSIIFLPFQADARGKKPAKSETNLAPRSAVVLWQPQHVFKEYKDYEEELTKLNGELDDFQDSCKGKIEGSIDIFEECYLRFYALNERVSKVYLYVYLQSVPSTTDLSTQFRSKEAQRASSLYRKFQEISSFFKPEVKEVGRTKIEEYLSQKPSLAKYRYDLEQLLRRRSHIVSSDAERFIAGYNKILEQNKRMDQAIWGDIQWKDFVSGEKHLFKILPITVPKKEKVDISSWIRSRRSPDRNVRENSTEAFFNSLLDSKETISQQLISIATVENEMASVQNYSTVLEMKMDEDDLVTSLYDNLIRVIRKNLGPTLHKYVSVKKAVLDIADFKFYDNYALMTSGFETSKKMTYSQARLRVEKALEPLGRDYISMFDSASDPENGWVYINKERMGNTVDRTLSFYGVHPYVLLFYTDSYDDIFTVAHEFGHAMHSLLSSDLPMPYYSPSPFVSEIASSVNEIFVYDYLVGNAERSANTKEEMYLLELLIDRIRMTLFRMAQMAEFEKIVYEKVRNKEILYFDYLREIYSKLMDDYYGPDFELSYSDGIQWALVSHLYPSFYVYSYSTSIAAAIEFVKLIKQDRASGSNVATARYIDFLKKGSSDSPIKMLREAGIDFTTDKPIQDACDYFSELLDQYVKLYRKSTAE